ncbi:MAG TPA: hypothetical protein VMT74_07380 [Gaiellaceae bacterium]|nr:hypothetical protein [Gaiellaceae bacterium]
MRVRVAVAVAVAAVAAAGAAGSARATVCLPAPVPALAHPPIVAPLLLASSSGFEDGDLLDGAPPAATTGFTDGPIGD